VHHHAQPRTLALMEGGLVYWTWCEIRNQGTWDGAMPLSLTSCVALDKLLNLSDSFSPFTVLFEGL
jgi:hypothetical protein